MLQIATTSLEPLTLDTFMQAVNFVLRNRTVYTSDLRNEFINGSQVGPAGIMDSEASQLRRLSSRTGGILETFVSISEDSTADFKEEASSGLPFGSSAKENATIRTVQFLHTTAKEFIQAEQRKLLLGRVDSVLALLDGHELLFLCCASIDLWALPISKHMFYHLKMAELHDVDCARNKARFFILRKISAHTPTPRAQRLKLILSQFKGDFCFLLMQHMDHEDFHSEYILLILAVAANAKKLVKHVFDSWDVMTRDPPIGMDKFCLMHVAAAGPDLVPIEHQDRNGMIQILVSSDHPVNREALIWTSTPIQDETIRRMTAFQVVLTRRIESAYNEDTRLAILKCLLDQGSDVDQPFTYHVSRYPTTPLAYCIQNESVAVVRLLLEYKAETSFSDGDGMRPIDYALIRQDKAILKALADHGCDRLTPNHTPSADAAMGSGVIQSVLMGSIGHPVVAVMCARDLRYSRGAVEAPRASVSTSSVSSCLSESLSDRD